MSLFIRKYLWVLTFAIFLLYLLSLPFAVARQGDFVHLWLGGQAAIQQPWGSGLYDPAIHWALLAEMDLSTEQYWGARFEQLGLFFYPPMAALLYAPLGSLSLNTAAGVMALLNLGLILLVAWGLYLLLEKRLTYAVLLLALLLYPAIFFNYALGQNGIVSLAIVVWSGVALTHGRGKTSGAILSLLLFKPNWLAAFAWWPLIQRRWQMFGGLIIGSVALIGLSTILWGWSSWLTYLRLLPRLGRLQDTDAYVLDEQFTFLSLLRRYQVGEELGWLFMLMVLLVTLFLLSRPYVQTNPIRWQLGLVWSTAVLLNPHLFHYDLLISTAALLLPLADWPKLTNPWRISLISLLLASYLAYPIMQYLNWQNSLPLPLLTLILSWLWFIVYNQQTKPNQPSIALP